MAGWPQLREARTVHSGQAPGTVVRCSLRDELLSRIPVSIVHFYPNQVPADQLAAGLAKALAAVPIFGGRMRTTGDQMEIVCGDQGVPMEFYTVEEPMSEAIGRVAMPTAGLATHCDALKGRAGEAPLLSVRVTEFADGGTAICPSFHHSLGDMQTYILFLQAWSAAVDGLDMPEVTLVEDRDAYINSVVPEAEAGPPSFRLPSAEEAEVLAAEVQASARANRTVQIYFGAAELTRMRDELAAEAGRRLSTNDAVTAHIHTSLRDLDDYDGPRPISMAVNARPRLGLSPSVVGNLITDLNLVCEPQSSAAQFATQIRAAVETIDSAHMAFRADQRLLTQLGRDRLDDCVPFAFDPARRTLTISNWTRFGIDRIPFAGHRPVLVAPTTAVSLPWVGWLVEGFDGVGALLTLVVPVRFAGKLRGADGRAQLHRYRADDDELPALATGGRVM